MNRSCTFSGKTIITLEFVHSAVEFKLQCSSFYWACIQYKSH